VVVAGISGRKFAFSLIGFIPTQLVFNELNTPDDVHDCLHVRGFIGNDLNFFSSLVVSVVSWFAVWRGVKAKKHCVVLRNAFGGLNG
jgi:hypothetical protein